VMISVEPMLSANPLAMSEFARMVVICKVACAIQCF
jgi:hypothetical protein